MTAWEFQIPFGTFTPVVWRPDEEARRICSDAGATAFNATPPLNASLRRACMIIRQGSPANVLIEESRRARLVILGSRGHGGFEGLLLGSVSATVAEHAKCTVLIAHGTAVPPELATAPAPARPGGISTVCDHG